VLCAEHGIGGDGEYCGDNDAQLGRINVLYREASGDKHVPRTVLFDFESSAPGRFAFSQATLAFVSSPSVGPLVPPPRVHRPDVDGVGQNALYDHFPEILEGGRTHGLYVRHPVEHFGHAADAQLHARVAERNGALNGAVTRRTALRSTIMSRDRA
jgi:hypothetical protein